MNPFYSTLSTLREYLSTPSNASTFTKTGQVTPEEFVAAGDYLVYKFPTWSWAPADAAKRVTHLPDDKQYLVLRNAPCHSRVDDSFSSWNPGEAKEGEDEWEDNAPPTFATTTNPNGEESPEVAKVKTVDEAGEEEEEEEDDDIPDEEEDDDEAIIKETPKARTGGRGVKAPLRSYNLYITYSVYYRVPRFYLSGYDGATRMPLNPPTVMFEDIAPDYREKTVTIEEFPPMDGSVQMASVHPCRHAEVMKRIFESMARRREREEWEEVPAAGETEEQESADDGGLRVDQYLVVFVKVIAGVVPGVELDYTMGI